MYDLEMQWVWVRALNWRSHNTCLRVRNDNCDKRGVCVCVCVRARMYDLRQSIRPPIYMPVCLSLSVYLVITTTKKRKSSVSLTCLPSSVSYYMLCCQLFSCFSTYLAENTLCKHGVSATCSDVSSASAHTSQRTHSVTMASRAICSA